MTEPGAAPRAHEIILSEPKDFAARVLDLARAGRHPLHPRSLTLILAEAAGAHALLEERGFVGRRGLEVTSE